MPDPQAPPSPPSDAPLYSYQKFAGAIRSLYPDLAHVTDDGELVHAVVSTHPEFKAYVVDPLAGSEAVPTPDTGFARRGPAPPAAPPDPEQALFRARTGGHVGTARGPNPFPLIQDVLDTPILGAARAIRGAQDLVQRAVETSVSSQYPQGTAATNPRFVGPLQPTWPPPPEAGQIGADIVGGGMAAGTVFLPEAAIENPLALARGLGMGTLATEAANAVLKRAGAPPSWQEFIGDVTGLVAGIGGEAAIQARGARIAAGKAAIGDQLAGEAATATADAAREGRLNRVQEATDLARSDAEREAEEVSLSRAQSFAAGRVQQARAHTYASAVVDLYQNRPGSAFDYLEQLHQVISMGEQIPDEALGLGQPPPKRLGPGGARFIAGSPEDLNKLDFTGPPNQPIGVPSTPPPDLADEIGNLLQTQLEGQRPGPPRVGEGKSVVLTPPDAADAIDAAQQALRFGGRRQPKFPGAAAAVASGPEPPPAVDQAGLPLTLPESADASGVTRSERLELQRIHDEMDMQGFEPAKFRQADKRGGIEYVPGTGHAGAPVYHDILAEGPSGKGVPTRAQVQQAVADYLAGKTSRNIWGARALKVARDRIARSGYGGWEPPPSPDLSGEPLPEPASLAGGFLRTNPPPSQRSFWSEEGHMILNVAPSDEAGIRQWLVDQQGEFGEEDWFQRAVDAANGGDTFGAWQLATQAAARSFAGVTAAEARSQYQKLYPGLEPLQPAADEAPLGAVAAAGRQGAPPPIVPLTEQQGSVMDQMFARNRAAAERMEATGAFRGDRSTLLKRLTREEGVLMIGPNNKAGMRQWLADREDAFGEEDWHQRATAALEHGDTSTAWRIAALSWRSWMAPGDIAAVETKRQGQPFPAQKVVATVEKAIGEKLPYGTTIGEGGVVKLPGNPGGITPTATDLVLGRTFVKSLVDAIEPERIVHIEDAEGKRPSDLPKALQVSSQMADEVLRRVPDTVIDNIEEVTGLDRTQQAAHLVRAASQAGKVLGTFGRFVQDNWDDLIHLSPETPLGGPGAASRIEFVPEDRAAQIVSYLDTLRRKGMTEGLTSDLKDFGFTPPEGLPPNLQERAARTWLKQQQKLTKWGQVIDDVAARYADIDKVTASAAMGQSPPMLRGVENVSQFMLATLLGQPATWMKIAESHGIRFAISSLIEEPIAGLASLARGKYAEATQHFQLAKRVATMDLTQAVPTGLLHSPTSESMEALFNYTRESARDLSPDDLRRTLASIDDFPKQAARLAGAQLDDSGIVQPTSTMRRIRNVLTVGIRASQVPTRAVVADATLRSLIYQKGDNPLDVFGSYGGLVEKYGREEAGNMVGAAVSSALNYTFAGEPLPESVIGKVLSTMHDLPGAAALVRTGQPFVRFAFATVPRLIWDRMPGSFLVDLPMHFYAKRGRMSLGMQLDALQRPGGLLDTMRAEVATSQYKAATAQTDMVAARMQAADASKAFKAIERRAKATDTLPDAVHDEMLRVSADLQDKIEQAQQAQRTYQQHDQESKILQQTYAQRVTRANQLREIDAPSPEQYIARQAVGLGLMTLAFAIRGSKANDGTKYYETRLTPGGAPIDLRHTVVGSAPFLHTADFFKDVVEQTDWDAYHKGASIEEAYHGKYTKPELLKEAVADWLSISPVVGDSATISDLLTGRAPEALTGTTLADGGRHFLALLGEQLGRLTMPLKALKDVAGSVYEPESHARTPPRPGPETPLAETLLGPAAKNVPGANELLPDRVSPMTGAPVTVQHGLLHQLTGITYYQPLTKFEEELNRVGIPYGKAVPKITGDRDFDNLVAKFYAGAVQQHLPDVMNDHRYQALPPDLKREVLTEVIGSLRAVARVAVASELQKKPGETDETYRHRMLSLSLAKGPQALATAERWAAQNTKAAKQEAAEMPAAPSEREEPEPPRPGAPPPSL